MKYEPINGGFKKLKSDLAAMSFKDKLHHLWTYYKGALVVLVIIFAICSIVASSCRARNTVTHLAGISLNINLTEEGQNYVRDGFFAKVSQGGLEKVSYSEVHQDPFTNTATLEESYMGLMSLLALATTQDLDYMLMDKVALTNMLPHNIYMDLRNFFTEAELEALGDKVVWMEMGDEETGYTLTPVSVDISDTEFAKTATKYGGTVYFSVVVNTPRLDTVRDFWAYLHAWGA